MPLPTMSLRAPPEHHQLIRDIATALRTRPELEDALRNVLQTQHDSIAERDTDVLQAIMDRLAVVEDAVDRGTAFASGHTRLLELRVKALEEGRVGAPATTHADGPGQDQPPTTPKPPPPRPRAFPAEDVEEAARLWDGGKGPSFSQIVAMKGWPHNHKGLNRAVRKYLQRNTELPST